MIQTPKQGGAIFNLQWAFSDLRKTLVFAIANHKSQIANFLIVLTVLAAVGAFTPCLLAQALLEGEFKIEFPYPLLGRKSFPTVSELAEIAEQRNPEVVLLFPIFPSPEDRGHPPDVPARDRNDYYAPTWSPDGKAMSLLRADLRKKTSKIVLLPSLADPKPVTLFEDTDSYDYMLSWARVKGIGAISGGALSDLIPASLFGAFVFCSTAGPDENLDIYLSALEPASGRVKNPVRLTKGKTLRRFPSLFQSRDQTRLLFCDGPMVKELALPPNLTWDAGDVSASLSEPLSLGYGNYPVWSPDGTTMAYAKQKGEEAGHVIYDLYLRGRDGIERPLVAEPGLRVRAPVWSPDGRYIAYYAARGESGWGLYIVDVRSVPAQTRLVAPNVATEENFDFVGPAWLSNGEGLIYFLRGAGGGHNPMKWALLEGDHVGEIDYLGELTTANDLAISPEKGVIEAAFVATKRLAQDVYVMIASEPRIR